MVSAMAGFTLTQAQAQLDRWLDLSLKLAETGQSFSVSGSAGGRSKTNVQAADVQRNIEYWSRQVDRLTAEAAGTGTGPRLVPMVCYD